jgi:hypothetical protein
MRTLNVKPDRDDVYDILDVPAPELEASANVVTP